MEINNAILECKEQMIAVDVYGNSLLPSYFIEAIQSLIDKAEEENEVIRRNHKVVTDAVQPYKNALDAAKILKHEVILTEAETSFKRYQRAIKGQQITEQDSFDYWVIETTKRHILSNFNFTNEANHE